MGQHLLNQCITRKKLTVTIASGPAATKISSTRILTPDFTVYFPSGNTGAVGYVGNSALDNTWIPRPKATIFNFIHGTGNILGDDQVVAFDLSRIYVLTSTANDTCIVEYQVYEQY